MEIESKYIITEDTAKKISNLSQVKNFKLESKQDIEILDTYFDTKDRILAKNATLYRLRKAKNKIVACFKKRVSISGSKHSYLESEKEIQEKEEHQFISQKLEIQPLTKLKQFFKNIELEKSITIKNKRTILNFKDKDQLIEVAIDKVTYLGRKGTHKEIELECESKDTNPIKFEKFIKTLETKFRLKSTKLSKYERAVLKVD